MSSEEEQQPGLSGVSREELSSLLGLNVPNDDEEEEEEEEAVGEEEEDPSCNQTMDDFDRQRTFQTQLLDQSDHAPQGSGRKRQLKPGHHTLDLLKSKKRSIMQIQNDNDLCCARALVTAKAKVDQHPQWRSFKRRSQDSIVGSHQPASGGPRAVRTLRVHRVVPVQ